jgi:hypothetical protein
VVAATAGVKPLQGHSSDRPAAVCKGFLEDLNATINDVAKIPTPLRLGCSWCCVRVETGEENVFCKSL